MFDDFRGAILSLIDAPPATGAAPRTMEAIDLGRDDAMDLACSCNSAAVLLDLGDCHGETAIRARQILQKLHAEIRNRAAPYPAIVIGLHRLDDMEALLLDIFCAVRLGCEAVAGRQLRSGADLQQLDVILSAEEAECGLPPGKTGIIGFAGDNSAGLLAAGSFSEKSARLRALGWHGGRLNTQTNIRRDSLRDGSVSPVSGMARQITRLASANAGVPAFDWIDPALEVAELTAAIDAAQRDGFDWICVENRSQVAKLMTSSMITEASA